MYGQKYKKYFEEEGINTNHLDVSGDHSGIALIMVNSKDGSNQIVINANANRHLSIEDSRKAKDLLEQAKVNWPFFIRPCVICSASHSLKTKQILICQLETPIDATLETINTFKGLSILNAAPSISNLPEKAFKLPDIFCVNELEAEEFTNIKFNEISDARKIIQAFTREKGCNLVVVTLGNSGAAFNDSDERIYHVPIQEEISNVADSTGE